MKYFKTFSIMFLLPNMTFIYALPRCPVLIIPYWTPSAHSRYWHYPSAMTVFAALGNYTLL